MYKSQFQKQQDEPLFACDPKLGLRMDMVGDKAYLDKLLAVRSRPEYYPLKPERIQVCVSLLSLTMFMIDIASGS